MHLIVMWMGGLTALLGVLFFVVVAISSGGQSPATILSAVLIGLGCIVSGALLYTFGAIVEHLIAIRAAGERQAAAFEALRDRARR